VRIAVSGKTIILEVLVDAFVQGVEKIVFRGGKTDCFGSFHKKKLEALILLQTPDFRVGKNIELLKVRINIMETIVSDSNCLNRDVMLKLILQECPCRKDLTVVRQ
jgi:hypothetical protein